MIKQQHIEGFGDEVTFALFLLTTLLITSVIYLWRKRRHLTELMEYLANIGRRTSAYFRFTDEADNVENSREVGTHHEHDVGEDTRIVYNNDNMCPICWNNCQYGTLSNCGHLFCCQCIMNYWRHGTWLSAINCPVCRTKVTFLMPQFTEVDLDDTNREQSVQLIREYNRRFTDEPRPFMDYLRDIPVLVPNLLRQMFTLSGLMLMFRLRILLLLISAALYIISPLDVMPEAFFGVFGLLDDIFVAFLLLVYLCIAYRQFLRV